MTSGVRRIAAQNAESIKGALIRGGRQKGCQISSIFLEVLDTASLYILLVWQPKLVPSPNSGYPDQIAAAYVATPTNNNGKITSYYLEPKIGFKPARRI